MFLFCFFIIIIHSQSVLLSSLNFSCTMYLWSDALCIAYQISCEQRLTSSMWLNFIIIILHDFCILYHIMYHVDIFILYVYIHMTGKEKTWGFLLVGHCTHTHTGIGTGTGPSLNLSTINLYLIRYTWLLLRVTYYIFIKSNVSSFGLVWVGLVFIRSWTKNEERERIGAIARLFFFPSVSVYCLMST